MSVLFALFRRSFKTVLFSRFLKVATATSSFTNEIYNGGFAPEFSISMLKEIITLVRENVYENSKQKAKLEKKYM